MDSIIPPVVATISAIVDDFVGPMDAAGVSVTELAEKTDAASADMSAAIDTVSQSLREFAVSADASETDVATAMSAVSASLDTTAIDAQTAAIEWDKALADMTASTELLSVSMDQAVASTEAANAKLAASMDASAVRAEADSAAAADAATINWGKVATAVGVVGIGVAVVSVKMAADFQTAMSRLTGAAGESQSNMAMVSQGIEDMAGSVGFTDKQLASAMYTVDSATIHGADSLTVLQAAAQGAKIEQADLGTVVDATTTLLNDYHLKASSAATVTSQMIAAVSLGKTNLQDLASSLSAVSPRAAELGISFAQVGAAMAAMTLHGTSAQQAAQNLGHLLSSLEHPTSTMTSEMGQLGLKSSDLAKELADPQQGLQAAMQTISDTILNKMGPSGQVLLGVMKNSQQSTQNLNDMLTGMSGNLAQWSQGLLNGSVGITDYTKDVKGLGGEAGASGLQFLSLYKSSQGFSDALKSGSPTAQSYLAALQSIVGTSDGLNVALALTGENAKTFDDGVKTISGTTADASGNVAHWSDIQGNLNQQLSDFEGATSTLAVKLGTQLLPVVTDTAKKMVDLITAISQGGAAADVFEGALVTLGAVGLGGLAVKLGNVTAGIVGIEGSFAWLKGFGVVGIIGGIVTTILQLKDGFDKLGGSFLTLQGSMGGLTQSASLIPKPFQDALNWVTADMNGLRSTNSQISSGMLTDTGNWLTSMNGLFSGGWSGIVGSVAAWMGKLRSNNSTVLGGVQGDIAGWFTNLNGLFNTNWSGIVSSSGQWVSRLGSTIWNGLSSFVVTAFSRAWSFITGQFNSFTSSLASSAFSSGGSIVGNLASGIMSGIGKVTSAIGSVVAAVASHLPHSPAEVGPLSGSGSPDVAGAKISSMIAQGIMGNRSLVTSAMANVLSNGTQSMGAAFNITGDGSFANTISSGYNNGNTQGGAITLNNAIYLDGKQLQAALQRTTLRVERKNVNNGLTRQVSR
jgi:TP901 family phage tail tape measure protein